MSIKADLRVVLGTRKTRLQELTERFNTWPQAKFYLEHSGVSVLSLIHISEPTTRTPIS